MRAWRLGLKGTLDEALRVWRLLEMLREIHKGIEITIQGVNNRTPDLLYYQVYGHARGGT